MPLSNLDHRERILMELLLLGDLGLSPEVIERNWNVDSRETATIFDRLEAEGFVENLGDCVYAPTGRIEGEVVARGGAPAKDSIVV